jgi:PAS domain S-box-containing protein/putative nucleotidyltransferase with HDIG domain
MPKKSIDSTTKLPDPENEDLRARLDEAEANLRAIRAGDWDALVVAGADGDQFLTLKQSELRYRRLFEAAQDGILILDVQTGAITDVNPFLIKMLGYSREELVEKRLWDVGAFKDMEANREAFEALQENEYIRYEDLPLKTKDGRLIQVEFVSNVYLVDGKKVIQCNIRDITERKHAEAAVRESEERYRQVWKATSDAMVLTDPKGIIQAANPEYLKLYGYLPEQLIGQSVALIFPEENRQELMEQYPLVFASEVTGANYESVVRRADGSARTVESRLTFLSSQERRTAMLSTIHDITERKESEQKIKRQLEHLLALSAIDQIIAANFDLKFGLSQIIRHIMLELSVDAADILILNPSTQTLEYGAEYGFRTQLVRQAQVRLGTSYAGRAALGRHLVQIQNLSAEPNNLLLTTHLKDEGFVCYYGVPLIAKGLVNGVLEVFHRTALEPNAEWLDFLNSLAGQTAIAIDNATLFENLQRSTSELTLAYDATIEGWSRALDLRDKETEGHSLRVTEMTLKLARAFNLSEVELVQVRWGALLHDIGKMGVPDGILLKPGPLTDEEWVLMRKHPQLAYKMLAPIRYLRLALDVPYCHHEKWDGTGYPRGLKGEQIPLTARIFSVVDVWDALSSDRPYRAAWAEDKVRANILASAGTYFDPQVVDVFLQMSQKTAEIG